MFSVVSNQPIKSFCFLELLCLILFSVLDRFWLTLLFITIGDTLWVGFGEGSTGKLHCGSGVDCSKAGWNLVFGNILERLRCEMYGRVLPEMSLWSVNSSRDLTELTASIRSTGSDFITFIFTIFACPGDGVSMSADAGVVGVMLLVVMGDPGNAGVGFGLAFFMHNAIRSNFCGLSVVTGFFALLAVLVVGEFNWLMRFFSRTRFRMLRGLFLLGLGSCGDLLDGLIGGFVLLETRCMVGDEFS